LATVQKKLVPCEQHYSDLNSSQITNIHEVQPCDKYFSRIDSMLLKHVPQLYQLFRNLDISSFGVAPPCYDPHKKRSFSTWTWRKMEDGGVWHQGQLGPDNTPDGMGVFIQPSSEVTISYYNASTHFSSGL